MSGKQSHPPPAEGANLAGGGLTIFPLSLLIATQGLSILSLGHSAGKSEGAQPLREKSSTPFSQTWEKGAGG